MLLLALRRLRRCGGGEQPTQATPTAAVQELANVLAAPLRLRGRRRQDARHPPPLAHLRHLPRRRPLGAGATSSTRSSRETCAVYAVWLNQRVTDARDEIDESILADPRVTQYWDGEGITGTLLRGDRPRRPRLLRASSTTSTTSSARTPRGRTTPRRSPARGGPVVSYGDKLLADTPQLSCRCARCARRGRSRRHRRRARGRTRARPGRTGRGR